MNVTQPFVVYCVKACLGYFNPWISERIDVLGDSVIPGLLGGLGAGNDATQTQCRWAVGAPATGGGIFQAGTYLQGTWLGISQLLV